MRIPHKVRIKWNVSYMVVWVDKFDDPDCLGLCDQAKACIYLKKGLPPKVEHEVFWHEVLHALEFEHDIKIPHSAIYDLAPSLVRLFNLNKWLK
jgi:hypothetical protein